jgi:hypothetical protein
MSEPRGGNEPSSSSGGWSGGGVDQLLNRASAVLAREAQRISTYSWPADAPLSGAVPTAAGPTSQPAPGDLTGRVCPVSGVSMLPAGDEKERLRRLAHELVAGLSGLLSGGGGAVPGYAGQVCPVTKATVPFNGFDKDRLRKQAHEFIETLLVTFSEATGEKGLPAEDKVPQLQCEAPVTAGQQARATLTVDNEETTPSEVSLYCTAFIADSGHEIPALRVTASPRCASIPGHGKQVFQIRIAVPQQTPPGIYSGLVQAMGNKYLKAVLSLEVR